LLGCFIERLSEPANEASKTNNNKAKNKDIKRSFLRHEGEKHYQRHLLAFLDIEAWRKRIEPYTEDFAGTLDVDYILF